MDGLRQQILRLAIKDMRKFGSKEEIAKTLRFAVDVLEGRGGAGVFRDWPRREPAGRTRTSGLPRVMQGHLTEEAASAAIKRFFCASLGRDGRIGSRGPVIFRYDDLLYPGGVINSV